MGFVALGLGGGDDEIWWAGGWRGFTWFGTQEVWMREDAGDGKGRIGGSDCARVKVGEKGRFWLGGCSDHGWGLHYCLGRHFWRGYY